MIQLKCYGHLAYINLVQLILHIQILTCMNLYKLFKLIKPFQTNSGYILFQVFGIVTSYSIITVEVSHVRNMKKINYNNNAQ